MNRILRQNFLGDIVDYNWLVRFNYQKFNKFSIKKIEKMKKKQEVENQIFVQQLLS